MANRTLHGIFCDDIRHEINGKLSLIGCYSGEMYVPTFPVTLARLCVHFNLSTPKEKPFEGPVSVTFFNGDTAMGKSDIDSSFLKSAAAARPNLPDRETMSLVGALEFSPVQFDKPTLLRVVAEVDGQAIQGPRLWVMQAPTGENNIAQ